MTTVADLIEFLQKYPKNALVFSNQYGGDWSEEHPIDFGLCEFHKKAFIYKDMAGNLQYTKEKDEETEIVEQRDVVRLVS